MGISNVKLDKDAAKARRRQREQGALKAEGIDLVVMPEGLKGRLPRWRRRSVNKNAEWADKPGSVVERSFISPARYRAVPRTLPERGPGRPIAFLFALAPDGACQAAVLPRRWWSLTPPFQLFPLRLAAQVGVFFSAALSVGSLRPAVSRHPALWSPDFPHARCKQQVAQSSGPLSK